MVMIGIDQCSHGPLKIRVNLIQDPVDSIIEALVMIVNLTVETL